MSVFLVLVLPFLLFFCLGIPMVEKVGILRKSTYLDISDNFRLWIPKGTPISVSKGFLKIHWSLLPLTIFKTSNNVFVVVHDGVPIARIPLSRFNPHPPYPLSLLM